MGGLRRMMSSPRSVMLLIVTLLFVYVIFYDDGSRGITLTELDLEDIEREIEHGKPVRILSYDKLFRRKPPKSEKPEKPIATITDSRYASNKYYPVWKQVKQGITKDDLFADDNVDEVLRALQKARIITVELLENLEDYESGTSEKWIATLEGGQKAMMKLVWERKEKGTMKEDALCNYGYEMPSSEVAGFHLHRILGFRNTPYVVGRKINLRDDILPAASPAVAKHIIIKTGNETCVVGKCFFCKDESTVCSPDGVFEASIALWVPRKLKLYTLPPKYMPFSTPRMDEWGEIGFNNRTYCDKVRHISPYEQESLYLDLFDFAVLDTLMYHYDSKHYVIDDSSAASGLTVRLDHGRAFCAFDSDQAQIFLAPITQCCTLRKSTFTKLDVFRENGLLTKRLRLALQSDHIAPVLHEVWFPVLERRLKLILDMLKRCADANGWQHVLV